MNKIYPFLLLIFSSLTYAQTEIALGENDKLIYLDSTWNNTSKANHIYYKIIKDHSLNLTEYKVFDYYKSNKIKKETTRKGKGFGALNGEETTYYENGNKQSHKVFINDKPVGKSISWYENGNLKEEGEYMGNSEFYEKKYKLNQYWDENNKQVIVDGNGTYIKVDKFGIQESGTYKDGYKNGVFETKNLKKNSSFSEKYEGGKFISGTRFFEDGSKKEYMEMETKPSPKGGIQDFYEFVSSNFRNTNESLNNKIQGKIFIKFTVDKDGKIVEPQIIKGLGYGLDEEAIRVLLKYGKWNPGEQRGISVRCNFSLPISIAPQN